MFKRGLAVRFSSKVFLDGASSATYTAPDGTQTTGLTVLLNESTGERLRTLQEAEEYKVRICEVQVQQADVTPAVSGIFTIGSDNWVVEKPPAPVGTAIWICPCRLAEHHVAGRSREDVLR